MSVGESKSASAEIRQGRWRDKRLWVFAALAVLAVVVRLIAHDYYLDTFAFECFPRCTFKQDLSNNVGGTAPLLATIFALAAIVRWYRLGRRPGRPEGVPGKSPHEAIAGAQSGCHSAMRRRQERIVAVSAGIVVVGLLVAWEAA